MKNTVFEIINNDVSLERSEIYGNIYKKNRDTGIPTFNNISINNIEDLYNSLLASYRFLNLTQIDNLQGFFKSLEFILENIQPEKLIFNNDSYEESGVLFWRESQNGISKLVFDEYGQIIYMYNGNDGEKVSGVFNSGVDMEKLLYKFISK